MTRNIQDSEVIRMSDSHCITKEAELPRSSAPNNFYGELPPCDTTALVKRFFRNQEDWGRKKIRSHFYQVAGHSYAKSTVTDKTGQPSKLVRDWVAQAREIIRQYGYKKIGVITHSTIEKFVRKELGLDKDRTMHFYNLRGRNDFKNIEGLFVLGSPYPKIESVLHIGIALAPDRIFELSKKNENGPAFPPYIPVEREFRLSKMGIQAVKNQFGPASGAVAKTIWAYPEPFLNAILNQLREAELMQAVYRARPLTNPADVWIFSDIPIQEIELDGIWDFAPISPAGLNWKTWKKVREWHESQPEGAEYGYSELAQGTGISLSGLKHYKALDALSEFYGAEVERITKAEGKGRPKEMIRKSPQK